MPVPLGSPTRGHPTRGSSPSRSRSAAPKRRCRPPYTARSRGSERGQTAEDNTGAFAELGFAPHVVGQHMQRSMATTLMGQEISLPVVISPTGVQAVHPEGEVAVARAAAARGTLMCLSNFASRSIEDVVAANPDTFFQMYWTGDRETMVQRMDRARTAGARGSSRTLDWSVLHGPRLGQPGDPREGRLEDHGPVCTSGAHTTPMDLDFGRTGRVPDLTAPNLAPRGGGGSNVLRRLLRVDDHAASHLGGRRMDAEDLGRSVLAQGRLPRR